MNEDWFKISGEYHKHVLRDGWIEIDVLMKALDSAGKSCIDNVKDARVFTIFESDPKFQGIIVCNNEHYITLRYRSGCWILHEPKIKTPLVLKSPEKDLSVICSKFTKNSRIKATIAVFNEQNINTNDGDCYPSQKPNWCILNRFLVLHNEEQELHPEISDLRNSVLKMYVLEIRGKFEVSDKSYFENRNKENPRPFDYKIVSEAIMNYNITWKRLFTLFNKFEIVDVLQNPDKISEILKKIPETKSSNIVNQIKQRNLKDFVQVCGKEILDLFFIQQNVFYFWGESCLMAELYDEIQKEKNSELMEIENDDDGTEEEIQVVEKEIDIDEIPPSTKSKNLSKIKSKEYKVFENISKVSDTISAISEPRIPVNNNLANLAKYFSKFEFNFMFPVWWHPYLKKISNSTLKYLENQSQDLLLAVKDFAKMGEKSRLDQPIMNAYCEILNDSEPLNGKRSVIVNPGAGGFFENIAKSLEVQEQLEIEYNSKMEDLKYTGTEESEKLIKQCQ